MRVEHAVAPAARAPRRCRRRSRTAPAGSKPRAEALRACSGSARTPGISSSSRRARSPAGDRFARRAVPRRACSTFACAGAASPRSAMPPMPRRRAERRVRSSRPRRHRHEQPLLDLAHVRHGVVEGGTLRRRVTITKKAPRSSRGRELRGHDPRQHAGQHHRDQHDRRDHADARCRVRAARDERLGETPPNMRVERVGQAALRRRAGAAASSTSSATASAPPAPRTAPPPPPPRASSRNSRPMLPSRKTIGTNTATSTSVVAITAKADLPRAAIGRDQRRLARVACGAGCSPAPRSRRPPPGRSTSTSASSVSRLIE